MKSFQLEYGIFTVFNDDANNCTWLQKGKIPDQLLIEKHLQKYISEANNIVILGSNMGILEVYFTKINPGINIYSFEPREKQFCLLSKNLAMNNIENVVAINNALGHLTGTVDIKYKTKNDFICDEEDLIQLGNGALIGYNDSFSIVTIDSLQLLSCDMIYIELSGFEYVALAGGIKTITKYQPTICFKKDVEVSSLIMSHFGLQNRSIEQLLIKMKYEIQFIDHVTVIAKPMTSLPKPLSLESEEIERLIEVTY